MTWYNQQENVQLGLAAPVEKLLQEIFE